MTKCFIVWNEGKTEGVIFRDGPRCEFSGLTPQEDAEFAATGDEDNKPAIRSSLAEAFIDCYGEDERHMQEVEIDLG